VRTTRFLLCLLVAAPLGAQLHPNLERGFSAEKMYDFSAVDSVNMFNGNMTLHIPLGGELRANGVLPYHLTLSYNSLFWEYVQQPAAAQEDPDQLQAVPTKHSNAGAGWLATMGRLIDPSEFAGNDDHAWMLVSPDGAEHALHPALHDETPDGVHQYTRDGSYARFTPVNAHQSTVELADGTTETFTELQPQAGTWPTASTTTHKSRLTSIADRFGNSVTSATAPRLPAATRSIPRSGPSRTARGPRRRTFGRTRIWRRPRTTPCSIISTCRRSATQRPPTSFTTART
jgi:hypothetical protein